LEAIDLRPGRALDLRLGLAEFLQLLIDPRQRLLALRIGVAGRRRIGTVGPGCIGSVGLPPDFTDPAPPADRQADEYDGFSDWQDMDSIPTVRRLRAGDKAAFARRRAR